MHLYKAMVLCAIVNVKAKNVTRKGMAIIITRKFPLPHVTDRLVISPITEPANIRPTLLPRLIITKAVNVLQIRIVQPMALRGSRHGVINFTNGATALPGNSITELLKPCWSRSIALVTARDGFEMNFFKAWWYIREFCSGRVMRPGGASLANTLRATS